jgi:hypothetical protein
VCLAAAGVTCLRCRTQLLVGPSPRLFRKGVLSRCSALDSADASSPGQCRFQDMHAAFDSNVDAVMPVCATAGMSHATILHGCGDAAGSLLDPAVAAANVLRHLGRCQRCTRTAVGKHMPCICAPLTLQRWLPICSIDAASAHAPN